MLFYLLFHSGLATVATGLQAWRVKLGYLSARLPYEPMVLKPFWMYTLGIFWLSVAVFLLLPMAWGSA
jgi:cytochrome c oxidase subunit I+III